MSQSISRPLNQSLMSSLDPVDPKGSPADSYAHKPDIAEAPLERPPSKKIKAVAWCGVGLLVVGVLMFLLVPALVSSQIKSQIESQVTLRPDNEDVWAHYPGSTGTVITRNFTFFRLDNEEQFVLHGARPRFTEIEGYKIQQFQDFFDISYNQDQSLVTMKDWLYFKDLPETRNLSEEIKIMNLPMLGYWYLLKNSRDSIIFIEGFSLLFTSLEDSIRSIVLGQGIFSQYLPDFNTTYLELFQPAGISPENSLFLWQDTAYGFSDKDNIRFWVEASQKSFLADDEAFSAEALSLKDYFTLSDTELYLILSEIGQFAQSLQNLIFGNHYCDGVQNCDDRYLAIRQMAQSYVTYNTPPVSSITPSDSICESNSTCEGYFPEIAAYYKRVYLPKHFQEQRNLQFDYVMVARWLDYNPSRKEGQYNKNESALLHIGNLDTLFENGSLHDAAKTGHYQPTVYLDNIMSRFGLQSRAHARVFWEWIKYLLDGLIRQYTDSNQKVGMSNSFSPTLYEHFTYMQDNLQRRLLKAILSNNLASKQCADFLAQSFCTSQTHAINEICQNYPDGISSSAFLEDAIQICRNKYQKPWRKWLSLGADSLSLEAFCDASSVGGFGQLYHNARVELNNFYSCDHTPNQYCSDYELALKQWANSTVTLNLPPSVGNSLQPASTFADWDGRAAAIEYTHYARKFPQKEFPPISMDDCYRMFNFEGIYSASVNIRALKSSKTNPEWKDYMRYVIIFYGFNGMARPRTAREFIFGYEDEYLAFRKNRYPPLGGDPSTPAFNSFNDPNITKEEVALTVQWYTGKNNISNVAQYSRINNLTYLASNKTKFNGNETYSVLESPWAENDYFYGTNGKMFKPDQFSASNISIYVPNIQRYGTAVVRPGQTQERFGYELQLAELGEYMYLPDTENHDNRKYYQKYYGLFNETSIFNTPVFMTKHYFLNSSENWTTYVDYYSESGQPIDIKDSLAQDSYVLFEPYSGVAFQSKLYLQANYFHEPDELFTYNQTCLLPVFTVIRSGNLTQESADMLFKPLYTALRFRSIFWVLGVVLAALGLAMSIFGFTKLWIAHTRKDSVDEGSLINKSSSLLSGSGSSSQKLTQPPLIEEIERNEQQE